MNMVQNDWNAIRAFYVALNPLILAEKKNEWATDAYCWDEGEKIIFFTPIENWLWADIRQCGAVLYPQYPVLNFFVDFANPVAKVAIECDGAAYHQDKAKDESRDKRLTDAGWTVYRISGKHCRLECDEDTGAPSLPLLFVRRICDLHGISRSVQSESEMPLEEFGNQAEELDAWWENLLRMRSDALTLKRGDL